MKRITLLIFFLVLLNCRLNAQDFWEHFYTPDSIGIEDIAVDSSGIIYMACSDYWGGDGGVYRSVDNSSNWQQFRNGLAHNYIFELDVDSEDNLFIGGNQSLYKSTDHAETWHSILSTYPHNVHKVKSGYDSIVIVGIGNENAIMRSGDHGITWQNVLSLQPIGDEWITDICFGPNGNIYACSSTQFAGIGNIYQSSDLGLTWQAFPREGYYTCLGFDNEGRLLAGTYGEGIYRYDFAISVWEHILIGGTPNDILVVPGNKIFLSWSYARVLESDDGGDTYYSNSSGIIGSYDMRDFAIDHDGRILVHGGWLYRSCDTIFTDINLNKTVYLKALNCYPNPFRTFTDFYFYSVIKKSNEGDLCIYSGIGDLILHKKIQSGEPFRWNTLNLPAGIYIARVSDQEAMSTIKLLHY
jgi:hypothetical protein